MDSDASMITGEYLQDHPTGYYQIQGVLTGIDFQYSSLDADPYPVVTAFLTTGAGSNSSSITSITAALTVNGVSQGTVTYDDVSLTNGATYIVQVQAVNVSTYATGLYSDSLTITKYFSGGGTSNETYAGTLMVVNDSSSPYGGLVDRRLAADHRRYRRLDPHDHRRQRPAGGIHLDQRSELYRIRSRYQHPDLQLIEPHLYKDLYRRHRHCFQ